MDREFSAAAREWLRNYHGSIDSTALLLAFDAGRTIPPGRCGATLAAGPGLSCELLAGHAGMHQDRIYPQSVISTGELVYWSDSNPDDAYRQATS